MSYDGYSGTPRNGVDHLGGNISEGDPYTYCPSIWKYLIDRLCITSMLDLGSGKGHAAHFFYKRGVKAIAVDGLDANVDNAIYPTLKQDLTKGAVKCRVDLVHCQEVVEHIEEKYLENLLDSLSCGQYIVMTHALPGQPGHHHVNCKPKEYWIDHLKTKGYNLLSEDTDRIKKLAKLDGAIYMAQSGLIFSKG